MVDRLKAVQGILSASAETIFRADGPYFSPGSCGVMRASVQPGDRDEAGHWLSGDREVQP